MANSVRFCTVVLLLFLLLHVAAARWTWDTFLLLAHTSETREEEQAYSESENGRAVLAGSHNQKVISHVERGDSQQPDGMAIIVGGSRLLISTDDYVPGADPSFSSIPPPPFP
ncbi:hypothetical protein GOP47_0017408 [Adiantum capillus-veneris]|uniref:Uncharacterized protein n=1 Tax=Adiantum capillus-veneris TaxID=13818 RepID=A0A9D4ZAR2_ADICA|nr:hypothetical protein GOP47_0017408 [Adiantum capillus-veneris]